MMEKKTEGKRGTVEAELMRISGRSGCVTPEAVVRAARNPKSPLHEHFEWDDSVAGQKWRLWQARILINSVTYTVQTETTTLVCPYYMRDPRVPADKQGYIAVEKLRTDEQRAHDAMVIEVGRIEANVERAFDIAAVLKLQPHVEAVAKKVRVLRAKLQTVV